MVRVLAFTFALSLPALASADECASAYSVDALLDTLGTAESALRAMDYAAAVQSGQAIAAELACLEAVLPVVVAPRVYRAVGAAEYLGGEPDQGLKWMRSAAALDPDFDYPEDQLPEAHPVRRAWQTARAEAQREPVELEGHLLGEGRHFVDGRRVHYPIATPDGLHLYQRDLEGVSGWIIDGNAFPATATTETPEAPPAVAEAPEPEVSAPPSPLMQAAVVKTRNWPAERVVLVGGGAAALLGSGLLYALSANSRSAFDQANSAAELERQKTLTNTYAISSGVSAAAGVSALGFGMLFFIIDQDPRPTLDLRF